MKKTITFIFIIAVISACYQARPVTVLPSQDKVTMRTLFIGLDGIDYELVKELKDEGYFADFQEPVPIISTFPTATTIGFTGLFWPLNVGQVPGYETRFYSREQNKIIGGTPLDVYKIKINYKYYFDWFRHTMESKGVMYAFPSVASKKDLVKSKHLVLGGDKRIVMSYLGGTDGSAHILGRNRTKRTLIFMDDFLKKLKKKHLEQKGEHLRIVLFSDHGFQYAKMRTVKNSNIKRNLRNVGLKLNTKFETDNDVVMVKFGLLSGGVGFTKRENRTKVAEAFLKLRGMDLFFWHDDNKKKIFIKDIHGNEAYFEYRGIKNYRYVSVKGDPIGYKKFELNRFRRDSEWKNLTYDHEYPDVGFRLYDSFFNLVKNKADFMFSLKSNYQFGSLPALLGTYPRVGQRGTHGGLFKQTTYAFAMTNYDENQNPPKFFRYNEFFPYYIPHVVKSYKRKQRSSLSSNDLHVKLHSHDHDHSLNEQLNALESFLIK